MTLEEYKSKRQELLYNFQARFIDLQKLMPCFSSLVNWFETDVITSGCPISKPLVSEGACSGSGTTGAAARSRVKNSHTFLITGEF